MLIEMKIGFQISGSTKRKKIIESHDDEAKKETVVSIELGTGIVGNMVERASNELVIPLPPQRNAVKPDTTSDIDQLAAHELLQDLTNTNAASTESTLVIGAQKAANSKAPLLLANVAPELLQCTNDDERFKVDISLRADNVDVMSESYQHVPIEQFGAAMLRGMGWTGPSKEEESDKTKYDIIPRENRLGLGATAKPPDDKVGVWSIIKGGRHVISVTDMYSDINDVVVSYIYILPCWEGGGEISPKSLIHEYV